MLVKNAGEKMQHSSIAVKSLDSGTVMFGVQLWLTSASCESRDTFSSLYPSFSPMKGVTIRVPTS